MELCSKKLWNDCYMRYNFDSLKQLPFAVTTALQTFGLLSMSSTEMAFTLLVCLQALFVEFLAFLMGQGSSVVLCKSQVDTQLTAVRIQIMSITNQPSK